MNDLHARLCEIAHSPTLLVATDFDGTLAPLVADPALAEAERESMVALKALSQMPRTHVAVISGRALGDVASRTRDIEDLHVVGSHGSEFESGFSVPLSEQASATLSRLQQAVSEVAAETAGSHVERKPASLAFHYRNVSDQLAAPAVDRILNGPATWSGVYSSHGKRVIELSVVPVDKGLALQTLRQRLGASAVLFIGDDVADEDAFVRLVGPDVGVKVGEGESRAGHRVMDPTAVARLLAKLAACRAEWLAGSHAVSIQEHSLLSDQRTAALLDPRGRVTWLCLPRLDSSAIFAELLGGPSAGFFEIAPQGNGSACRQKYAGRTFIVRTEWPGFTVTDYLDCGDGRASQRAGRTDLIRVIQGRGRVRVTFAPRLDFGRLETKLRMVDTGLVVEGGLDPLVLYSPGINWTIQQVGTHHTAAASVELREDPITLELRYGTASLLADRIAEATRRERTARYWSGWAATLVIPPAATELVLRSALVLKALTYGPTGAIAAAATTSLPGHAGGVRNWDYRFCWPRDAAMASAALLRLGATEPAVRLLDWILGILDNRDSGGWLAPVYTVTGHRLAPEAEVAELSGYLGSRPVRVSNAAAQQVQLDIFGPIAELLALLAERGAALSSEHWRVLVKMVEAVAERWGEPDHGIWEARRSRRHHVHSKVMCWQTVDRAIIVAHYLGRRCEDWVGLRDQIASNLLQNGFRSRFNAFSATYEDDEIDAATLWVGLSGMLPPQDPRFRGTVKRVEESLRSGSVVYRYRYDDGLPGAEGGFHLCTTWLIEALAMCDRRDEAQELFRAFTGLAGSTGLLSEQFDPHAQCALGNVPQVYSHLGLINAAHRLAY